MTCLSDHVSRCLIAPSPSPSSPSITSFPYCSYCSLGWNLANLFQDEMYEMSSTCQKANLNPCCSNLQQNTQSFWLSTKNQTNQPKKTNQTKTKNQTEKPETKQTTQKLFRNLIAIIWHKIIFQWCLCQSQSRTPLADFLPWLLQFFNW